MRCPRCDAKQPDGTAICSQCDEILDPSQFESDAGEPGEDDGERTDVSPAPSATKASQAARARAVAAAAQKRPKAAAPAPRAAPGVAVQREVKRPYLADAPSERPPDPLEEARKSVDELGAFFRSLAVPDRVSAGASLALVALLMLPWRWTKIDDDESIGLIAAFPALVLAVGVALLVYFRARRASAALAANLLLAQIGAALLLSGFCAWFLRSSTDERVVRGVGHVLTATLSTPLKSAYLGTACALIVLIASIGTALGNRKS